MAEYVLKYYDMQWADYNYSLVEITLLNKAGQLTMEQIEDFKLEYEKEKDVVGFMEGEAEDDDIRHKGIDTGDAITFDKRINPDYLTMLSAFFLVMQVKIGIPVSFMG